MTPAINETIPYLLSKEGPNAHLFKFQLTKRVNHVHEIIYRNMVKQQEESLQSSRDSY